jgi:hypothetical protein
MCWSDILSNPAVVAAYIAAGAAIFSAFLTWLFTSRSNRSLEEFKTQLNIHLHTRRIRYDKEFEVYQNVWKTLIELRNAAVHLGAPIRPTDLEDCFRSPKDIKKERFERYKSAFQAFYAASYFNQPFFHSEVFSKLEEVLEIIVREASDFKECLDANIDLLADMSRSDRARKNVRVITDRCDEVREIIRMRIQKLE